MLTDKLKHKGLSHLIILLELKAVRFVEPVHEVQLLDYLKAAAFELRLFMNFGNEPTFKRFVYNKLQKQSV
ncbi:MAG: GxxExxY protein [Gammaproteobacteria bacterium]